MCRCVGHILIFIYVGHVVEGGWGTQSWKVVELGNIPKKYYKNIISEYYYKVKYNAKYTKIHIENSNE
jgi:uncharacterized membrane protein